MEVSRGLQGRDGVEEWTMCGGDTEQATGCVTGWDYRVLGQGRLRSRLRTDLPPEQVYRRDSYLDGRVCWYLHNREIVGRIMW